MNLHNAGVLRRRRGREGGLQPRHGQPHRGICQRSTGAEEDSCASPSCRLPTGVGVIERGADVSQSERRERGPPQWEGASGDLLKRYHVRFALREGGSLFGQTGAEPRDIPAHDPHSDSLRASSLQSASLRRQTPGFRATPTGSPRGGPAARAWGLCSSRKAQPTRDCSGRAVTSVAASSARSVATRAFIVGEPDRGLCCGTARVAAQPESDQREVAHVLVPVRGQPA